MKISQLFNAAISRVVDLIFPPKCISCASTINTNGLICSHCWSRIEFISKPCCQKCNNPYPYDIDEDICYFCSDDPPKYFKAVSVVKYDEFTDKLVFALKYYDRTDIATSLAKMMAQKITSFVNDVDFVLCVPSHKDRLKKRGYNQAALLANSISKLIDKQFLPSVLSKIKETTSQSGLKKEDRIKNVKGSFIIDKSQKELVFRKKILLVDDVITTGATINECCKQLLKAGVKKIYVVTFAKTCL